MVAATEPYRFAVPLTLWGCVLAGPWLIDGAGRLRGLGRGLMVLLAVLLLPRVYQQVVPVVPEISPLAPPTGQAARNLPSARLGGVSEDFKAVTTWLEGQPDRGRVLVQYASLGEYLRWASDRQIIGGFHDRRQIFQEADLFYFTTDDARYADGLDDYFAQLQHRVCGDDLSVHAGDRAAQRSARGRGHPRADPSRVHGQARRHLLRGRAAGASRPTSIA
jgi:hypothetical protein